MTCRYCHEKLTAKVSLRVIFSWQPLWPQTLCQSCSALFIKNSSQDKCPQCSLAGNGEVCHDCQSWMEQYPHLSFKQYGCYRYNGGMKEWLHDFKYRGNKSLAACFQSDFRINLANNNQQVDVVIPIPITATKRLKRGFNQVEALLEANQVSYSSLLVKKEEAGEQSKRNREARLAMGQPFAVVENGAALIKNKHVVLIDDVYTTGRTLYWAALLINTYEPASIRGLTLAR